MGIYKVTNKVDNKIYVGCSKNIEKRWTRHKSSCNNPNDRSYNTKFYTAMREHGVDNFTFEVLEECSEDLLMQKEKQYIKDLKATDDSIGYNLSIGGDITGFDKSGENHGNHKLTEADVIEIRELYAKKEKAARETYEEFYSERINWTGFHKIWNGYTWTKVMMEVYTPENKEWHKAKACSRSGSKNGSTKLTEADVLDIRTRRNSGEDRSAIYDDYKEKITRKGFGLIWNDVNWKNIQPTDQ